MDPGAPPPTPLTAADAVPPVAWPTARKVGLAGLILTAGAAGLGLAATAMGDSAPWVLSTARLLLVAVGAVTAGAAVSLRPDLWRAWAIGSATAALAIAGTPAHWDSFRLLFEVLTAVAAGGAVVAAASPAWRYRVLSGMLVFHFGGIFVATTSPPPTPWLTEQLYYRLYNPYLHFVHLRNAYHFYSPEPGPASILACLATTYRLEYNPALGRTETLEDVLQMSPTERRKRVEKQEWVVFPKRPADVRDPLGLTYYRRLSLTEQVARAIPELTNPDTFSRNEVKERRQHRALAGASAGTIPIHPGESIYRQYLVPTQDISRFLLPSYAQHLLLDGRTTEEAARTTLKVYRLEHRIISVQELLGVPPFPAPLDPYSPVTYRPFFLGEFAFLPDPADPDRKKTRIALCDPQEPMLYWMLPVVPRPGVGPRDDVRDAILDYLSAHALEVPVGELSQDPYKSRAFDWSQLR